jgi:hypothetical protein
MKFEFWHFWSRELWKCEGEDEEDEEDEEVIESVEKLEMIRW